MAHTFLVAAFARLAAGVLVANMAVGLLDIACAVVAVGGGALDLGRKWHRDNGASSVRTDSDYSGFARGEATHRLGTLVTTLLEMAASTNQ